MQQDRTFRETLGGKYQLAAHPWDAIGEPPPPGGAYALGVWAKEREEIVVLLKEADGYFEEASEKQRDAYDDEQAGDECLQEALALVEEKIEPTDPGAAHDFVKLIESKRRPLILD